MNEPLLSRAFSRGSRQNSAQPNDADPLAELARIVGEDDPFRDIFGEAQRAARPAAQQPQYETADYDPNAQQVYGAHGDYAADAASEAYDPAYYEGVGSESGYLAAPHGSDYYDEETELGPDISLKKRRGGLIVAGIITLAVLGGAAFAMYRSDASQVASANPPVIHADPGPTKTVPEKTADAAPQHSKLIYDRVGAADKPGDEKVVSRTEEPMDLPAADAAAPSASPDPAASAGTANPAAADAAGAGADGAASGEPRKVRTVLIRPDGTMGTPGVPDAAAPPPAPLAQMASAPVAVPPAAQQQSSSYPFSIIENDDLARPGGAPTAEPAAAAAPSAVPAPLPPVKPPAPAPAATPAPVRTASVAAAAPSPEPAAPATRPAAPQPAAAQPAAPQQNQRVASLPPQTPARPAPVAASSSAKIPAGTFTVQLTSQRSEQDALAAYSALQKRFPALLGTRQPSVQKADLGSRGIYYRVKVVAGTRDAALQLCSGLKAQGGDCIVGN